jgi:hypothetical protein
MQQRVDMMYVHGLDPLKGWFHLAALDKSAPIDPTYLANGIPVLPGRVVTVNDAGNFTLDRLASTGSATASTTIPGGVTTCPNTTMPMFLWAGSADADVYNDGTALTQQISGANVANWTAVMPAGIAMALVATGGYELQTTEYDTTSSIPTYVSGRLLTHVTSLHSISRGTSATYGAYTSTYPNCGLLTSCAGITCITGSAGPYSQSLNLTAAASSGCVPGGNYIVGICSQFTQGQVNYLQPTNLAQPGNATGYNANGVSVLSFYPYFLPSATTALGGYVAL